MLQRHLFVASSARPQPSTRQWTPREHESRDEVQDGLEGHCQLGTPSQVPKPREDQFLNGRIFPLRFSSLSQARPCSPCVPYWLCRSLPHPAFILVSLGPILPMWPVRCLRSSSRGKDGAQRATGGDTRGKSSYPVPAPEASNFLHTKNSYGKKKFIIPT